MIMLFGAALLTEERLDRCGPGHRTRDSTHSTDGKLVGSWSFEDGLGPVCDALAG
jgi:hypothetical protein